MKKHFLSRSLLAAAITATLTCAAAQTDNSQNAAAPATPASYAQTTQEWLQNYVKNMQSAFPYYDLELKEIQTQGTQSTATIQGGFSFPADQYQWSDSINVFLINSEFNIQHGLTFTNDRTGVAAIEWTSVFNNENMPEILALFGDEPFEKGSGVVTLGGDIFANFSSSRALEGSYDNLAVLVPSYSGSFSTYKNASLAKLGFTIPSIAVHSTRSYDNNTGIWLENIELKQNDKPINGGLWDFNGHTEIDIGKVDFRDDDESFLTLNGFKYAEDASIDANGLWQATFSLKSDHGVINTDTLTGEAIQITSSQATGLVQNIDIKTYLQLFEMGRTGFADADEDEIIALVLEMFSHGPKLELSNFDLILNGEKGSFSYDIGMPALTESDKQMELFLLLMTKLQVHSSVDIPVNWLKLFVDEMDIEEMLEEGRAQGYIEVKDNRITSTFAYEMGSMKLNGKPINTTDLFGF